MTGDVKSCGPDTNLAAAAMIMWENDCGTIPVVDDAGKVIGMITDRDICMAAATKDREASRIAVGEVITGNVFSCRPEDDLSDALKTMQNERVRRLPVVNGEGELCGILSVNDILLRAEVAGGKKTSALSYPEAVDTLKSICEHRTPQATEQQTQSQAAAQP
jgi:CBS domain-containing protein